MPLLWLPSVISLGPSDAWREGKTFLCGLLVLTAVAEVVREDKKFLDNYMILLAALGLFLGLDSLYQWFFAKDLFGIVKYTDRANAVFSNSNYLAFVLSATFPSALYLIYRYDHKKMVSFACVSALMSLEGIILSGTRSAWASAFLTLCFVTPVFFNTRKKILQLGVLCLSIAIVLMPPGKIIFGRLKNMLKQTNCRIPLWKESLEYIKQSPFLGRGIGNWKLTPDWASLTFPHNFFLEIGMECGLPALAIFFYCLYRIGKIYIFNLWQDPAGRFVLSLSIGPFIAAAINLPFFSRSIGTFMWLCLGLAIGAAPRMKEREYNNT